MQAHWTPFRHHTLTRIQRVTVEIDHFGRIFLRGNGLTFQTVGIDFTRRRVFFDFLVHQRLGRTWLIRLVVTMTAIADQIDKHITLKGVAIVERQTGHKRDRFRIVSIDVENRCQHHFADIGAVRGRTRIFRVGGGEANLVVDDDANGTAHFITARL